MNQPRTRRIAITMNEMGEVNIEAPLSDKIFCLGLLEVAKKLVHDFKPAEPGRIVTAPAAAAALVRAKGA